MVEEEVVLFDWFREEGKICYKNETTDTVFCGQQEPCYDRGMVLPLFNESTWDWKVRAALYLIGLLYRLHKVTIRFCRMFDFCAVPFRAFSHKMLFVQFRTCSNRPQSTSELLFDSAP
jgi:hypothetical protein